MLHHINKKKKIKKEPLDYILYFFAFTTPLFELPQAYLICSRQNAADVSLLTWAYFAISSVAWLCYGVHENIRPIIFAYSLYCVIEVIIVAGIIRYG
ncbi:MAG TPA: hypothetical protein VM581_03930 [Magnetospirillaceae bacterium]|nr:hypothetical protein [Magnetospirillaceae bacterium]